VKVGFAKPHGKLDHVVVILAIHRGSLFISRTPRVGVGSMGEYIDAHIGEEFYFVILEDGMTAQIK
jgi:hypothetical protein